MKNLHDIIQKNMEEFDEKFYRLEAFVKEGIIYGKDGAIHVDKNGNQLNAIKDLFISSQLSIIQAIDEWAESNKVKDVNECENMNSGEIRNKTLSELHSFLNNAKTKLQ